MATMHLIIKGKVQGVFFRASAKKVADNLGVFGWIRNTHNGEVEAEISSEPEKVQQFINWCNRGPEDALVIDIVITVLEDKHFHDFKILR